ncbi:MAG TPA: hypothetical protein VH280_25710 [Verrucomicrobiae bacterium]|jgi:hypothetical protein|nr:hypothetical protein [Verrucomicrobiae bacterium]
MKSIFNDDQFEAMINHLVAGAGIATATSAHDALYQILGGAVFFLGLLMSHRANSPTAPTPTGKGPILAVMALFACLGWTGCTTTDSTAPGPNGTTVTTKTVALDQNTVAQVDAILAGIVSNAPAVINDVQAVSSLVHGTNSASH